MSGTAAGIREEEQLTELPANMEKTRQAGIGVKVPTVKARTSAKLASEIDGPTSASARPTRDSSGEFRSCRFRAFTRMHILSTPTCHNQKMFNEDNVSNS